MKKILLIHPPFERFMGYTRYYYPIGLACIAAMLKRAGHNAIIYDMDHNPNGRSLKPLEYMKNYQEYIKNINNYEHHIWKEIIDVLKKENADYVGISCYTDTVAVVRNIISLVRINCPGAKVVVGGVHATLRPKDFAQLADYIVRYEGEESFLNIIEHPETLPDALPGNHAVIVEARRIDSLDSLPFPALECLHDIESYSKLDRSIVMSTRGCPNMCKFCNSYDLWKCKTTRKSPEYFFQEIKYLHERHEINDFYITDDVFTLDADWMDKFLELLAPLHLSWRCLSHINYLNRGLVRKMIKAGCRSVKIGVESGSDKILQTINKDITRERIMETSDMLKEENMDWSAFFIIGFPGETREDIQQTQELINSISARIVTVNIYTPLPDNRFNDFAENSDGKYSFRSPFNNFTQTLDNGEFNNIVRETFKMLENKNQNFMDHQYQKKVLVMGDLINDIYLLQDSSKKLFTWQATPFHRKQSGAKILGEILSSFSQVRVYLASTPIGMETFMRWFSDKDRLFYKETLFYTEGNPANDENADSAPPNLYSGNMDLFAVFNMNVNNTYEASFKLDEVKDKVQIVLRSRFLKQGTSEKQKYSMTPFVENVLKKKNLLGHTVLVLNINDFSEGYSNFKLENLSWEHLIIHFIQAMDRIYEDGYQFQRVVLTVNHEGVILYSRSCEKTLCDLVYFGNEIQGDYARAHTKVVGQVTLMQAVIVKALAEERNLTEGAQIGLLAMRKLMSMGYSANGDFPNQEIRGYIDSIESLLMRNKQGVQNTENPLPATFSLDGQTITDKFSIVHRRLETLNDDEFSLMCYNIANNNKELDIYLRQYPSLRLGELISFERDEIEKIRSLYNQIEKHISAKNSSVVTFSICVLGAPGTGKTFAVKQIIKQLNKDRKRVQYKDPVDMSQCKSSDDSTLNIKFQQMRDARAQGLFPVIFIDEFDAPLNEKSFGWLPSFILPMNTGKFKDGSHEYDIGPSIFIFAGSRITTRAEFMKCTNKEYSKIEDFQSRITEWFEMPSGGTGCPENLTLPELRLTRLRYTLLIRSYLLTEEKKIEQDALMELLDNNKFDGNARKLLNILNNSTYTENGILTTGGLANN